jgi:outer membrane lipoprotein-sorting protein
MIKASGGRNALEKLKDTTITGTAELVQFGMTGEVTLFQKEPNKMRLDFNIAGFVLSQSFDGETAWTTDPETGGITKMSDKETEFFRREAYGNAALLAPGKLGITYTLKGKENIDGKDCFVLEQVHSDGYKAVLFIDTETFLTYKVNATALGQTGEEVETETFYSEFKDVKGIKLAHKIVVFQGGMEYMDYTTTQVTFNSGLEDSLFKMDE